MSKFLCSSQAEKTRFVSGHLAEPSDSNSVSSFQDTPFLALFQTNLPPSDVEANAIREVIASMEHTLALLEGQLPSCEEEIKSKIQVQTASLIQFVERHKQLLSPLRRIPVEILGEIFSYLTASSPAYEEKAPKTNNVPWSLCAVSRWWQAAALSSPLLWTTIHINMSKDKDTSSYVLYLNLLLDRSYRAPLYVHVFFDGHHPQDFQTHLIIDALVHHCERWRELTIRDIGPLNLPALEGIRGRLSELRKLSFQICAPYKTKGVVDFFEVAPKLSEVRLQGVFTPGEILLPWSQLTKVHDRTGSSSSFNKVCNFTADKITSLSLGPWAVSCTADIPNTVFPQLENLELDFAQRQYPERFVDNLITPSIKTIEISGLRGSLVPRLQSMIIRSSGSRPSALRKLNLTVGIPVKRSGTYIPLSPGVLTSLLQYTPQLEELKTPLPSVMDLSALIVRQTQPLLVPNLQLLSIDRDKRLDDEIKVLNILAITRCDMQPFFDANPPDSRPCEVPSQSMTLHINHHGRGFEYGARDIELLEGFRRSRTGRDYMTIDDKLSANDEAKQCTKWRARLAGLVPSVDDRDRTLKCHPGALQRISDTLFLIENSEIEFVNSLFISRLHLFIHRIDWLFNLSNREEKKYKFKARADKVLRVWEPMLRADIRYRRWALRDEDSITYVSKFNKLRKSPDSMKIIYGLQHYSLFAGKYRGAKRYRPG